MANYKIIFEGDEQNDVFSTYEDAENYALYLVSCYHTGGKVLEMSNPGDYPYDPDDEPEYEIVETDEPLEEIDESVKMAHEVIFSPGVYDDEGEYIRCPNCGSGLHYYNGVKTCPYCGSME